MTVRWIASRPGATWKTQPTPRPVSTGNPGLQLTTRTDQCWDGFGGCFNELGWMALQTVTASARREIFDALFNPGTGCRFNYCRLPIGASDYAAEWYSHNENDGDLAMRKFSIARDRKHLIPYIRCALDIRPDLTLFASPWSPPAWMKHPRVYNYGTLIWTPENLRAYALYFVRFVQAYAKEGISIRQIHPQNEPVADQKFPSCLWTGEQLRDFIRDYLAPAFKRARLDCEIWLGTLNTDDYDGFPFTVLRDPEAYRQVAGVAFQWAGRGAIQRTHAAWPEKKLMQSENECGDGQNTWAYAGYVFNLIRHYLGNGANAYVYWNMVLEAGGRSTWGWRQNSMISIDRGRVVYNPEFFVMKHFSRFIDPGARRVELEGPWAGNALAFVNPSGARVVVVRNPLPEPAECVVSNAGRMLKARLAPESINTLVLGA